jgi:hypothetical protein
MGNTRRPWIGHPFVAIALALPSGVVFAFYKTFPDEKIEPRPGAGWLDTIFANQYVVFSVRVELISIAVVLVLGALFVAVSIVYRMVRHEFVHKLGWVEVSVPASAERDFREVDEFYRRVVMDAWERNEEMAGRLGRAVVKLAETTQERDRLREECDRLRSASPGDT